MRRESGLKRIIIYFVIMVLLLFFPLKLLAENESARLFIEERMVERGLERSHAHSLLIDPRISIQPDIVIMNLFYSSPRGTEEQPSIMQISPQAIEEGKEFINENRESLTAVEKRFGTSPRIITAILIVESKLGKYPMRYDVVTAYFNLGLLLDSAYLSELQQSNGEKYPLLYDKAKIKRARTKARWALDELYHLVHIAAELNIDPLSMKGSFSGALGPAQFIPSTFRAYGIDANEDGICDPFDMVDAKASIGNYLKSFGWSEDAPLKIKRNALWHYNQSQVYVNTIMMLYDELGK